MFLKVVIRVPSMLLAIALLATAFETQATRITRPIRSIWPFVSDDEADTRDNFFIKGDTPLPQRLNLTGYPVWKVHKYQGIDLRPIKVQPGSAAPIPQVPSVTRNPEEPVDLSFLDDLGGVADFLPDPEEDGGPEEIDTTPVQSSPGFLSKLFSKFPGFRKEQTSNVAYEEPSAPSGGFFSGFLGQETYPKVPSAPGRYPPGPASVTYYLPETRGSYVRVRVPPADNSGFRPIIDPRWAGLPNGGETGVTGHSRLSQPTSDAVADEYLAEYQLPKSTLSPIYKVPEEPTYNQQRTLGALPIREAVDFQSPLFPEEEVDESAQFRP